MDGSTNTEFSARLLCLGNDILADDALGIRVADGLRGRMPVTVDVVSSMESGLRLIDHLVGVPRVVVVDTVQTGTVPPGSITTLSEKDFGVVPGRSAHYIGLFDALALARHLGLPVADELLIVAVEAADCRTIGGEMHPAVASAIPEVIRRVEEMVR